MVRVDAWLWSVRITKTRADAVSACRAGHVKVNGKAVKPAQTLVVGDRVAVWHHHRDYVLEVVELLSKRVGAPLAKQAYIDHSPPPPVFGGMPTRDRGAGRPTKKERRELEKFQRRLQS